MSKSITLERKGDVWELVIPEDGAAQDKKMELAQQAGILEGIRQFEVMGIPLGDAVIGGGVAALSRALLGGLLPGVSAPVAKLVSAWAILQFGPGILGKGAARMGATFLAWDAVAQPVEDLVRQLTRTVGLKQGASLEQVDSAPGGTKVVNLEAWLRRAG